MPLLLLSMTPEVSPSLPRNKAVEAGAELGRVSQPALAALYGPLRVTHLRLETHSTLNPESLTHCSMECLEVERCNAKACLVLT